MATKQEIIAAIRRGQERVFKTFEALSEEQLGVQVHDDEGDRWNAKQVLAHLASARYQRFLQLGQGGETPEPGRINIDEVNRQRVGERISKGVKELLGDFKVAQEDLIKQVEDISEETLSKLVPWQQGTLPFGDLLLRVGGLHPVNHTLVIEQALGLAEPTTP